MARGSGATSPNALVRTAGRAFWGALDALDTPASSPFGPTGLASVVAPPCATDDCLLPLPVVP